ncbi:prepilin-type N-terminal cleavage/methylation domain protein [Collimonas arenae]|uniref:Prepilin-type N-terminal cleavage/methylation domain protein n=1 Tax=Collimonas arenae TaxID=279058 RepID=A0A127PXC1_9BURK|nr:prepilin-type N-terminal cleavage/methylation domain-containing protein [Collimonas arenae]AMP02389.1 prepilin-type N-terminal cleavage/methylation domain protein [Collimonas arenae]AMP12285.1 prepilin-type N-terminal cleavage/methylation domain protein [Collimonas arenae]
MKNAHRFFTATKQGYTLIELMLIVAIIGILAAVTIPAYQVHVKKEKFAQVVAAGSTARAAVEACAQQLKTVAGCNGGSNGVPADVTGNAGNYVASVSIKDGVVTVVPQEKDGILASDTYVATPTMHGADNPLQWSTADSGCIATALCK